MTSRVLLSLKSSAARSNPRLLHCFPLPHNKIALCTQGHTFKTSYKNPAPEMATHAAQKNPNLLTSLPDFWSYRTACHDANIITGTCSLAG